MNDAGKSKKKAIALLTTCMFLAQQTLVMPAFASNISNISPQGNIYNIDPEHTNGNIGMRGYDNFILDDGHTANLKFNEGMTQFINYVQNQVQINGILNTMKGDNFYNGKAVFVSPSGMVVGASGVLNVGSLEVYTPTEGNFTSFKNEVQNNPTVALQNLKYTNGSGDNSRSEVKIQGKVFSAGDVYIDGGKITVDSNAGVFAGVKQEKISNSLQNAQTLFDQLVNADVQSEEGKAFGISESGKIEIVSTTGIDIKGDVKNFAAKGEAPRFSGEPESGYGIHLQNSSTGTDGINISGTVANVNGILQIDNNNGDLNISGKIQNDGTTRIYNIPMAQLHYSEDTHSADSIAVEANTNTGVYISGDIDTKGELRIRNRSGKGLNITGRINHDGDAYIWNGHFESDNQSNPLYNLSNNTGGLNIESQSNINIKGNAEFKNTVHGVDGLNVEGTITVGKKATYLNEGAGGLNVKENGHATSKGGLKMENKGSGGLHIDGIVENTGDATVDNYAGNLSIGKTFTNTGNATIDNHAEETQLIVTTSGTVTNNTGTLKMVNVGANGLNIQGTVTNNGTTTEITNSGKSGLNVSGTVHSNGDLTMTNTGEDGIDITNTGKVTGNHDIKINNTATGNIKVQGTVNAKNDVNIIAKGGGSVVIGHESTNNNITAGRNIDINVTDANILNAGVIKTLLNAGGDLNMTVQNGTIGETVQQTQCQGSGCTGIGPKEQGSRDFKKSINGKITGKVTAKTTNTKNGDTDLLINYASIGADMKINTIKADGRVILTVDDDFGETNTSKQYNMLNAKDESVNEANVEGWGLSLIADGSIGEKDKKLTFIQTKAPDYAMDALANKNIYIKEDSYNVKGRENETEVNKVCTMIAREGDIDAEFAGNTTIDNVTAEGDIKIVTRGKTLTIENLGDIKDDSVIPNDYFGERHDGYAFDQRYDKEDHRSKTLPNNVVLKALDINHNIRETQETVTDAYGDNHEAWADSTVTVKHAVLDNGELDITADNVYANGIEAHFNKEGFTKKRNGTTEKVVGASEIPTGHAVRPQDVTDTGHDITERNYYTPKGDGDGIFDGKQSDVDDEDDVVDATPLEIPDETKPDPDPDPEPEPEPEPTPPPPGPDIPDPTPPQPEIPTQDGSVTFIQRKIVDENVDSIDKRQFIRFDVEESVTPVKMEQTNNGITELLDVSRGGIAVKHNNKLKVGDIVPIHLKYGDLDIKADVKVVSATTDRAGAMFVNLDKATSNQLLYLNLLLNDTNDISFSD